MKKKVLVDIDEVLVNITPLWVQLAQRAGLVSADVDSSDSAVLGRDKYWLPDWVDVTDEQKFLEIYTGGQEKFYNNLPFTKFAYGIKELLATGCIELVGVSHVPVGVSTTAKQQMFNYFFGTSVQLDLVPLDVCKASYIFEKHPDFSLFVDDRDSTVTRLIELMADNTGPMREYHMPILGYNVLDEITLAVVTEQLESGNGTIAFYHGE